MDKRNEILNELKVITPLADQFSAENPYWQPTDYFREMPENLMERIKQNSAGMHTTGLPSDSPNALNSSPMAPFAHTSRLPSDSPAMRGRKRRLYIPVAAVIAGLLILGGWWYFKRLPGTEERTAAADKVMQDSLFLQKMRSMSEREITGFIEASPTPVIYGTAIAPPAIKDEGITEIRDEDIKWMFAEVSETELQHFLDDDGGGATAFPG